MFQHRLSNLAIIETLTQKQMKWRCSSVTEQTFPPHSTPGASELAQASWPAGGLEVPSRWEEVGSAGIPAVSTRGRRACRGRSSSALTRGHGA